MHAIIAFYSRTGTSQALAAAMSRELEVLGHSSEALPFEPKRRLGLVLGTLQALFRRPAALAEDYALGEADLVVLVGPVWAGNIAPPMRGFIARLPELQGRRVVTMLVGTWRYTRLARNVAEQLRILGADWVASRALRSAEVKNPDKLSSVVNEVARRAVQ